MKKYLFILLVLVVLTGCNKSKKKEEVEKIDKANSNINIVTSLEDKISDNTIWCGTFNLVWNELKENLLKGDAISDPEKEIVTNLNKSTFSKDSLDSNSYYIKIGKQTFDTKKEIESAINEKFNQKSDILDNFTWEKESNFDFIYAMLYKNFKFNTPFKKLEDRDFNNDNKKYNYFGITKDTSDGIDQVTVLFYNDNKNNSVKISTKGNDEIILVKTSNTYNNFLDLYNSIIDNSKNYNGEKSLDDKDTLYVPYLDFNVYKDFEELKNLTVRSESKEYVINQAVQSIKLKLNETGGEIKSEAALSTKETSAVEENKPRYFNYDESFIIFLKEEGKEYPYFAAKIDDLSKFQKIQ